MNNAPATFEVEKLFELPPTQALVLQGQIKSGVLKSGMQTKVLVDSQLYMVASIKSVEFVDGPGPKSAIGLVLDALDQETRELWQALCLPGDVLKIEYAAS